MRIIVIFTLMGLLFASCGFRMYENGHRVVQPTVSSADSMLTLDLGAVTWLPDSRAVLAELTVKGPDNVDYGYNRLLAYARSAGVRLGGNLLKVKEYRSSFRQKLHATVYRIDPPDLARLKDTLAIAIAAHQDSIKDLAIVHIKDYDDFGVRHIWFNDTLLDSIRGPGFDGLRGVGKKTLVFHRNGTLKLGTGSMAIQKGKEYFLVLWLHVGRGVTSPTYQLLASLDKVHFDNRSMTFDKNPFDLPRPGSVNLPTIR
jgi:hypothetical protein